MSTPITVADTCEVAETYEKSGLWLHAARMWLSAASIFGMKQLYADAERCSRRAGAACDRHADEMGRKVPSPTQKGGDA